jgi:hypothetical protein
MRKGIALNVATTRHLTLARGDTLRPHINAGRRRKGVSTAAITLVLPLLLFQKLSLIVRG